MNLRFLTYKIFALIIALNYFAFRVELFQDEYAEHHSGFSDGVSFARTSTTWETYDKDNAPQAFTVNAEITLQFISPAEARPEVSSPSVRASHPIRDKSPPVTL